MNSSLFYSLSFYLCYLLDSFSFPFIRAPLSTGDRLRRPPRPPRGLPDSLGVGVGGDLTRAPNGWKHKVSYGFPHRQRYPTERQYVVARFIHFISFILFIFIPSAWHVGLPTASLSWPSGRNEHPFILLILILFISFIPFILFILKSGKRQLNSRVYSFYF